MQYRVVPMKNFQCKNLSYENFQIYGIIFIVPGHLDHPGSQNSSETAERLDLLSTPH